MILVIGGTSDSRNIAVKIAQGGSGVLVSTATSYGADLAAGGGIEVTSGRLDRNGLKKLIITRGVRVIVDASHPFAREVSENTFNACEETGVFYIRYSRPPVKIPDRPLVVQLDSIGEAIGWAFEKGNTILAATGSKTARLFTEKARDTGKRVVFRVTPDPDVIKGLIQNGAGPEDIVAMQGPFSEEMNIAIINHYSADVLVTKDSGAAGGFGEKISAAEKAGIPIIIVRRPPELPGAVFSIDEVVLQAMTFIK